MIDYSNISLEYIKEVLKELFKPANKPKFTIADLKAKILPGYYYTLENPHIVKRKGERTISIGTGSGGVLQYIDACVDGKMGIAEWIQESIFVHIEGKGNIPLSQLSVLKKPLNDEKILN